jgi:hypothetical protein
MLERTLVPAARPLPLPELPRDLVESMREGRCVAFVGAGFSAPAFGSWQALLQDLLTAVGPEEQAYLGERLKEGRADAFEEAAEILQDRLTPEGFQKLVRGRLTGGNEGARMQVRKDLLLGIPFRAILTTNFDGILPGSVPRRDTLGRVLTAHPRRTSLHAQWEQVQRNRRGEHTIKLHGDLADAGSVVLSKTDYRRRLYDDAAYLAYLRSVFLFDTVLFIGFSFKDNYINELRSEVLALLGNAWPGRPKAYAIADGMPALRQEYLRRTEDLVVLPFDRDEPGDFYGFEAYLQALFNATNPARRLGELLERKRILWVSETSNSAAYAEGVLLDEARRAFGGEGATVEYVDSAEQAIARLSGQGAADFCLEITKWDEARGTGPAVLRGIRKMGAEVPVFVFAGREPMPERKPLAMRLGAAGYYYSWDGLLRGIEQVLDADPEAG